MNKLVKRMGTKVVEKTALAAICLYSICASPHSSFQYEKDGVYKNHNAISKDQKKSIDFGKERELLIPRANVEQNTGCLHFLDANLLKSELRNHYIETINSTYKSYHDNNLDKHVVDVISFRTGIGTALGRRLLGDNNHPISKPKFYWGNVVQSSSLNIAAFNDYIESRNIYKFVAAITATKFKFNTVFRSKNEMHFILGMLISSGVSEHNDIALLLGHGVRVFLSDLVEATKRGLAVETVSLMHNKSGILASQILKHNGKNLSLLNYAITHGHYELALYWFDEGSLVEPDEFTLNALDLLTKYRDLYTFQEFYSLSSKMLNDDILPNSHKYKSELLNALGDNLSKNSKVLLSNKTVHQFNKSYLEIATLKESELYSLLLKNKGIVPECKEYIGKRVIKYSLKDHYKKY